MESLNKVEAYSNANTNVLGEIRNFNENFVKLDSEISIVKKFNTLLNKRVVDMEGQCWANSQYSRRECLEIVAIPRDVSNKDLEFKVIEVFKKVACGIPSRNTFFFFISIKLISILKLRC